MAAPFAQERQEVFEVSAVRVHRMHRRSTLDLEVAKEPVERFLDVHLLSRTVLAAGGTRNARVRHSAPPSVLKGVSKVREVATC